MGVLDINPGTNPKAYARMTFGVEGNPDGFSVDTSGHIVCSSITSTGIVDVTGYGALGDGVTDDYAAITAAIAACPPGGVVYFPAGVYMISNQISLPPRVTLQGTNAPHWPQYAKDHPGITSCLRPIPAGYLGSAVIRVLDKVGGGWTYDYASSSRIVDMTIDGAGALGPAAAVVHGIYSSGEVVDLGLTGVAVYDMTGDGLRTDTTAAGQPKGWQMIRVAVQGCDGSGYNHLNAGAAAFAISDMTYSDCWAGNNIGSGWVAASFLSVDWQGCRAEFNHTHGWEMYGNSRGRWINCDTDRNTMDGWHCECLGNGARSLLFSGCLANRDGCNNDIVPGGYSAFNFVGTVGTNHIPVVLAGCVVNVNRNDAGAGIYSPDYGLSATYTPQLSLAGCLLNGTVASFVDTNSQIVYDNATRFNTTSALGVTTLEAANTQRINGLVGTNRDITFYTSTSGKRWAIRASSTAEGGGNTGTNLNFVSYDDAGAVMGTPLSITRSTNQASFTGNISMATAGYGLKVAEGANARMGVATLVAGTVVVNTTAVAANSRVFLTSQSGGGTPGFLRVSARVAGTSFTILSSNAADTSVVAWFIVDPA